MTPYTDDDARDDAEQQRIDCMIADAHRDHDRLVNAMPEWEFEACNAYRRMRGWPELKRTAR